MNPPTLVETWRTAPYSHLGVYTDIREMIPLPAHNKSAVNHTARVVLLYLYLQQERTSAEWILRT